MYALFRSSTNEAHLGVDSLRLPLRDLFANDTHNLRRDHACFYNITMRAKTLRFLLLGVVALVRQGYERASFGKLSTLQVIQQGKAIFFGHHKIEDDGVGFKPCTNCLERLCRRETRLNLIPVPCEFHTVHVHEELVGIAEKHTPFTRLLLRLSIFGHHIRYDYASPPSAPLISFAPTFLGSSSSSERSSEESELISENGTSFANALIIASSCIVSIPSARAAAHRRDSTGLPRIIFSIALDISKTSNTAIRPRNPVGEVGVRDGSHAFSGTLNRCCLGSDSSCVSMFLRSLGVIATSSPLPSANFLTRRCATEQIRTGGIRYGSTPLSMRRGIVPTASLV